MDKNEKNKYPKILVISNNPFSKTSNNGKTLASFFKRFPPDNIAQLYFSSEVPNEECYGNYYRISDLQVLKSVCTFKNAGNTIDSTSINKYAKNTHFSLQSYTGCITKSNLFRILRDLMWGCNHWKTDELASWIKKFSPDIVFFCAGDSAFAYDVVDFVLSIRKARLITYITDDYVLPRHGMSFLWEIRRKIIFNKMNTAILRSKLFITISEEMRNKYKDIFGVDSIKAFNMSESMKINDLTNNEYSKSNIINFIYAGGLHFKRYETLNLLAKTLDSYNNYTNSVKAFLSIYSTNKPSKKIIKMLNIEGSSKFLGGLSSEDLKIKLNEADIPVHVESFDMKSIESTRLSISTKIPEYLSLGKPLLAIGPKEIASMRYIADCAFCINNADNIFEDLTYFMNEKSLQEELSKKAVIKYNDNHNINLSLESLTKRLINLHLGES